MRTIRLKSYTLLLLTTIIWGAAGSVIKFTLEGLDADDFLAYRFIVSGMVSLGFLILTNGYSLGLKMAPVRRNFPLIIVYGLFATTFALFFLFLGMEQSTVLDLTLITIASPLIVMLGGARIFKDRITKREKKGIALVVIGVIISQLMPILGLNGTNSSTISGILFLAAFLFFDTSSVLIGKYLSKRKVPEAVTTNFAFVVALFTFVPYVLFKTSSDFFYNLANLPIQYHLGVWYMALMSGSLAYFFWLRGQRSIEISEASLFYYLQPVVGVPLAVMWLGEDISLHFVVGAVIIVAGLVIASKK